MPPLDTISRTLTSATSATASNAGSGLSSIQSLTIVIPATCSVIVLTVIIIVACFVLGTKRTQQFESTLLTAIGANGANANGTNGIGGNGSLRQNSIGNLTNGTICRGLLGTPHHSTPLSGGCDQEPRYGTNIAPYEHYGFTGMPNGGLTSSVDTYHLSIMGNGDNRKELCNGVPNNIEMNSCGNNVNYATLKKRPVTTMATQQSTTTCLDSKLIALSEGKGNTNGTNINTDLSTTIANETGNDAVHYFQTPYALSRITRFTGSEEVLECNNNNTATPVVGGGNCIGGCGQQMNGGATLRQNRGQSDHVYDMPFPPKWV